MSTRLARFNNKTDINVLIGTNVPSKTVTHFVHRTDMLAEVERWLLNEHQPTAIVLLGMGGSGKTQLALECCRIAEASLSFVAIIWIDASLPATVAQSYNSIALKVTGESQAIVNIAESIAIVEVALRQRKGKWLAVFDNFDKPKDFQEYSIQHYVPKAANGRVLFTSRHADSQRLGHVIKVTGMSEDESLDLLLQQPTSEETEQQQGLTMAAMLRYLPLALDQAGAYIRTRCLPLHDFVSHYKKRKQKIFDEIPEQWEYRRKLEETEKETMLSVFITWELSFEQLGSNAKSKNKKKHFLTLTEHFNNKCISQRYFEAYCRAEYAAWMQTFMTDGEWDECEYGDLVAECRKLLLIQTLDQQVDGVQFFLHPVVNDWLKVRKQ